MTTLKIQDITKDITNHYALLFVQIIYQIIRLYYTVYKKYTMVYI